MALSSRQAQDWNSSRYAINAGFVSALGQPVLELLKPQSHERILDLGCGDGALTEKLAKACAAVVGVDASPDMIQSAKKRGLDARIMDAYGLAFESEFDAAFSNAALHWMKDNPEAVLTGVARALRPGGRFAAEMGGHGCVAAIVVALLATLEKRGIPHASSIIPWRFPTPDEYGAWLSQAGFEVEYIALIPRPTSLPTGMRGWLETFAIPFTKALPEQDRSSFLDDVIERLRPVLCDEKERWTADYMRLRFLAIKK